MTEEEITKMVEEFRATIYTQLRTLGVVLYDDVGERIRPSSAEEFRIVDNIARNIAQLVVLERENNKLVAEGLIHAVKFAGAAYDNLGSILEADLKDQLTIARKICQTPAVGSGS